MTEKQAAIRSSCALLISVTLLLAGCSLTEFPDPPTAIPTAAPPSPLPTDVTEPSFTATPTRIAASETPAVGPSTAVVTVPPTVSLPPLPQGAELTIRWLEMVDSQAGWAVGEGPDGIARALFTADGGQEWRDVSPESIEALAGPDSELVLDVHDAELAWAVRYAAVDAGPPQGEQLALVWRSEDGGSSWTASPLRLPFVGSRADPPYLRSVGPDELWFMARAGGAGMQRYPVSLLRSVDAGQSWTVLEDPFEGADLQSCHKSGFAVSSAGIGLVTLDSCPIEGAEVRFTTDAGASWTRRTLPEPAVAPDLYQDAGCESSSPVLLGALEWRAAMQCRNFEQGSDPAWFLYESSDGGESWSAQSYPGGELVFVDENQVWALSRELYFSSDGGGTWVLRKEVFWDGQFSWISEQEGWAVARQDGESALVHTEDGGRSWQIIEPLAAGEQQAR